MICENCKNHHEGNYGSGRFCSVKCSRSFSTKKNKGLIYEKVSKTLKETLKDMKKDNVKLNCEKCKKEFEVIWNKRNQKCCSRTCSIAYRKDDPIWRGKISKSMKGKNSGDKNGMYGITPENTKRIKVKSYKEPRIEFYVKSSYEKKFVDFLNSDSDVKEFLYEPSEFRSFYLDPNGINRTYQPDFYVNGKVIEIKNSWNVNLEETKIKEESFRNQFPNTEYEIKVL
jgi:protein-arginine kinase activator protein McsA